MKRIRTYALKNGVLTCNVVFIPEGDNCDLPMSLSMSAQVEPGEKSKWLTISADIDIPLKLRVEENQFFLNLLTQMYYA